MSDLRLKVFLRTALAWLYYYSGGFAVHLYWRRRRKQSVLILTFHRVLPERSAVLREHLALRSIIITHENFQKLLGFLNKHFELRGLEALGSAPSAGSRALCVLTFDDGYHDFFEYAWPAMQRLQAPAIMFLPTALVNTAHCFWWDEVYHLGMTLEQVPLNGIDGEARELLQRIADTPSARRTTLVYRLIELLQDWAPQKLGALIEHLKAHQACTRQPQKQENRLMAWEEIKSLHAEGVQFGSHTRHHFNLAVTAPEQLREEVTSSKCDLELKLRAPVEAFSFPGGHVSDEALNAVAQAGYTYACGTRPGFNRPGEELICWRRNNVWDGTLQDFHGRFSPAVFALNLMRKNF
ncbi:MAG: polysaccharide deacetylase family protein [bacterium]